MMKINLTCGRCLTGRPGGLVPSDLPLDFDLDDIAFTEIQDGHVYEVICKNGHKLNFLLANEKFEILFDYACHSLKDGYYQGAVASYSAALERFYEFCIRSYFYSRNINNQDMQIAWNLVARQSERQLGMFASVYLCVTGKPFRHLQPDSWVTFRNEVVHKGVFPSKEKAMEFGETVRNLVNSILKDFKESCEVDLFDSYTKRFDGMLVNEKVKSRISLETILSVKSGPDFSSGDYRKGSLDHVIIHMENSFSMVLGL